MIEDLQKAYNNAQIAFRRNDEYLVSLYLEEVKNLLYRQIKNEENIEFSKTLNKL